MKKELSEEINSMDKYLLSQASELYSVPMEVLEGVYRLGRNEGYYQGLCK